MNVFDELQWRGALYDATDGAREVLGREKVVVYNGFDPSARSLHVGSLLPIMGLVRFQRHGHTPIAIVGGGTGMIGDPSGRSAERPLLGAREIEANVEGIRAQLARFLDFDARSNPAQLINNADWLLESRTVDFMRDVGKHITVNYMLAKESVKTRLDREEGMSFTEFSYMLLQAYDYVMLAERRNCTFQTGGSDQWGNILTGVELVRRMLGKRVHGVVFPLLTDAAGQKFGKSVGGAPTLDPQETSPYRFYQFWINTSDQDVIRYLKLFTLLDSDGIGEQEQILAATPEKRAPQRLLAREVTRMVHGGDALARAEQASRVLFGGDIEGMTAAELLDIFADVPSSRMGRPAFENGGMPVARLMVKTGLARSVAEARRLADQGGVYVNNRRVAGSSAVVDISSVIEGRLLVLRRGARSYHLVRVV